MKPLPLLIVCSAIAGFLYYAVYAYKHQPELNHGYKQSDIDKVSEYLAPPSLAVYLFADDGQPVNQRIKVMEWARARKTLGK
jgi:hypothetical protein